MRKLILLFLVGVLFAGCVNSDRNRIQPWTKNPWYWQFKGNPVMLLGASGDDNLFQWPAEKLIPHLDSMQSIGANYVRNTMSDRVVRGFELYPFRNIENEKYDLEQWNPDYWNRFETFLEETGKRDIIVQIEVWDRFDYSRENWPPHPYNPKNNINYTESESGLDTEYPKHPYLNLQPFFFTTPKQRNNEILLKYQKKQVEKMLSYSLKYDHVLYCMDNETSGEKEWAFYWAKFILDKAAEIRKQICVTEMWDNWDLKSEPHKRTFDNPDLFAYCDVSQNNQQKGQVHWDNFQWVRNYISSEPRPVNTVKTYGADGGTHGNTNNGIERWWRHVIGGAASVRFHRPPSGLGLSELSMASVKAAREIESVIQFWDVRPGNDLLSERSENEAYLASKPGETYLVLFTDGGEIGLDLSSHDLDFALKWMEIRKGQWSEDTNIGGGKIVTLTAPGADEWIAILTAK